ncbi:hypothetical protein [Streptomyces nojiriensis]|uniref:hypothetical protein n=1 Tax=Streptomyces nojiriensis TaxID=66374 RepID=UPI00365C1BA6
MTNSRAWEFGRYNPKTERVVESLCTLGNGRCATRGSAPENVADAVHSPGTYLAGCYGRLVSTVAGAQVTNEDMVRLTDRTALRYRCLPEGGSPGDWLTPDDATLRQCRVSLDLRRGTLTRRMLLQAPHGRRLARTDSGGPRSAG